MGLLACIMPKMLEMLKPKGWTKSSQPGTVHGCSNLEG